MPVSVILPTYNHERYVAEAIDSVLAQTRQDLELVVVDDASTDATWSVVESFDDPRLRCRRHAENRGADATLNEAIGLATGDTIAILNSDDTFEPERLEHCLGTLEETGADLVGTDIRLIGPDSAIIEDHWWIDAFRALKDARTETDDWLATLLEGNVFMTTSNFVFRRELFERVGGFHDYRYVLDYDFLLRALVDGARLAWLDRPLMRYRLHDSNTIFEKPMAANEECAAMLRRLLPELLADDEATAIRLRHLASQWQRLEGYILDIGTAQRRTLERQKENLWSMIRDRDQWIEQRNHWIEQRNRWIEQRDRRIENQLGTIEKQRGTIQDQRAAIDACQRAVAAREAQLEMVLGGASFRIGRALTAPARWLRNLVGGGERDR